MSKSINRWHSGSTESFEMRRAIGAAMRSIGAAHEPPLQHGFARDDAAVGAGRGESTFFTVVLGLRGLLDTGFAMPFNPNRHHRQSLRLRGYDYARAGVYFLTICAQSREPLFGRVVERSVQLSTVGEIVQATWLWLAARYAYMRLDAHVVMPDHLHGVLIIDPELASSPAEVGWRAGRRTQNGLSQADQWAARHARRQGVAAQLLRAHCP